MKQIGLALNSRETAYGTFPPGYYTNAPSVPGWRNYQPAFGWAVYSLAYAEQVSLYNCINQSFPMQFPQQDTVRRTSLQVFLCPSSGGSGPVRFERTNWEIGFDDVTASQYVASSGYYDIGTHEENAEGVFFRNSKVTLSEITDGASTTILIGERSRNYADATWLGAIFIPVGRFCTDPSWPRQHCGLTALLTLAVPTPPNDRRSGPGGFASQHRGGANFLFADGNVRFVKDTVSPRVFEALSTRAGGEVVGSDQF